MACGEGGTREPLGRLLETSRGTGGVSLLLCNPRALTPRRWQPEVDL